MIKVGAYKIIDQKKLIVEYYSGNINVDDLILFKKVIRNEPNYNFSFNTILDMRDTNLNIDESDLIKFFDFLKREFYPSDNRQVAYLTSKPNHVVLSTLFSNLITETNEILMNLNTFSTINAVVNWFNIKEINNELLNSILNELKTYPNIVLLKNKSKN